MSRSVSVPTNATWAFYATSNRHYDMHEWHEFLGRLRTAFSTRYPSFKPINVWQGEDHAILQNGHCVIGLSEYRGLIAIWAVPDPALPLHAHYANLIKDGAHAVLAREMDGELRLLQPLGTASNGEAFFRDEEKAHV